MEKDSASYRTASPQLASRRTRLLAAFIDGCLGFALVLPLASFLGYFAEFEAGLLSFKTRSFVLFLWILQYALLHGWLLYSRGQTIGKMVCGLRIASIDDNRVPSLKRTLLMRHIVFVLLTQPSLWGSVLYLINVLYIFRDDQRCLHDLFAYTRVITVR